MSKIDREWVVKKTLGVLALMTVLGILLILFYVVRESIPAFSEAGPQNLLLNKNWKPDKGQYGILVFFVGTLATTFGALILGVPLALGTAIYLNQMAPKRLGAVVTRGVELLAGIPSIVLGWLGFTVMVPWIRSATRSAGTGILAASVLLAIMILPTIATISKDALDVVSPRLNEPSLAMGATRWQTIRHVLLPAAKNGIFVAIILGMGRAIGETMAVALVIGPASVFPDSLWSPTHTLTTKILIEMGESTGVQRSALFVMALVLLLLSMAMIMMIRVVSKGRVKETNL